MFAFLPIIIWHILAHIGSLTMTVQLAIDHTLAWKPTQYNIAEVSSQSTQIVLSGWTTNRDESKEVVNIIREVVVNNSFQDNGQCKNIINLNYDSQVTSFYIINIIYITWYTYQTKSIISSQWYKLLSLPINKQKNISSLINLLHYL